MEGVFGQRFFFFLFPKTKKTERERERERDVFSFPLPGCNGMWTTKPKAPPLLSTRVTASDQEAEKKKPGSNEMHTLGKKGHGPRQGRGMEMHKWARLGTQEDAERQGVQA